MFHPAVCLVTPMPDMTESRFVHTSIYLDNRVYVMGGRGYGPEKESVLGHVEYFDLKETKWVLCA